MSGFIDQGGRGGRATGNGSRGGGAKEGQLTRALGWFSIGLGLAELAAPDRVARWIGVREGEENCTVLRGLGLRELVSGVGILTQPRPAGWLWSRVAGDLMDLTLLSRALASEDVQRERVAAATAAVAGVAVLDLLCSDQLTRGALSPGGAPARYAQPVTKSLTINRPASELYAFWRDFTHLPDFMLHLESVQVIDDQRSHWVARGPAGVTAAWDAEIVEEHPNARIAWRSLPGSSVENSGVVRFQPAPGGRGTEVRVEMQYRAPGGAVSAPLAALFGGAIDQMVLEDLRRFKQLMETGEIPRADAQLWGAREGPAQPPPRAVFEQNLAAGGSGL